MFLFNVGLLTLMNMDSLTFIAKLCPSLPPYYMEVFMAGWVACMATVLMNE